MELRPAGLHRIGGGGSFVTQVAALRDTDAATVERDFFRTARPSSFLQPALTTIEEVAAMIAACRLR